MAVWQIQRALVGMEVCDCQHTGYALSCVVTLSRERMCY